VYSVVVFSLRNELDFANFVSVRYLGFEFSKDQSESGHWRRRKRIVKFGRPASHTCGREQYQCLM